MTKPRQSIFPQCCQNQSSGGNCKYPPSALTFFRSFLCRLTEDPFTASPQRFTQDADPEHRTWAPAAVQAFPKLGVSPLWGIPRRSSVTCPVHAGTAWCCVPHALRHTHSSQPHTWQHMSSQQLQCGRTSACKQLHQSLPYRCVQIQSIFSPVLRSAMGCAPCNSTVRLGAARQEEKMAFIWSWWDWVGMCRSVSSRHRIGNKKLPKKDTKKVLT